MRGVARRICASLAVVLVATALSSCVLQTEPATNVGPTSAKVWGKVAYAMDQGGYYWFQRSSNGGASWVNGPGHFRPSMGTASMITVSDTLTGLAARTTYVFRLCGVQTDADGASPTFCADAHGLLGGGYDSFTTLAPVAVQTSPCSATLSQGGSLQSFINARSPGQIACLASGTYSPNSRIVIDRDITLRPAPGGAVTIDGELALNADGVTVQDLHVRGTEEARVVDIKADNVTVDHLDITVHPSNDTSLQGIMVGGSSTRAVKPRIAYTRIHGVGSRLSESGCCAHDHAVYCANATGLVAEGNWLYRNRDGYGFHLYPDCDSSWLRYNVEATNDHGDLIGGEGGSLSSGNVIENNSYSNNSGWYRPNRKGVGCSLPGGGNVVRNINVYPGGGTDCPFSFSGVTSNQPAFANEAADDYRITGPQSLVSRFGLFGATPAGPRS